MKAETTYMKTLGKVEAKLSRMKEQAAAVRWFYENGNLPESYNRALRLEELSEQTVLLTRVLPAYTGAVGAITQTDAIISDTIPVEVGFTAEGWFSIRIPALLPKKASGSADYIRSYLYPAMRKFFEGKPPVRFRDCVLAYRHVYDRSRPERAMRDHDNIETNMVTDILALYVLPDDHPAVCSHYYCSAAGSEDRTEVYVIPKHDFPMWMVEEKTLPVTQTIILGGKYIVAPARDGLMIVNVRRARERILYDRALAALTKNEHVTQANMFPVKVEVGAANRAVFDEKAELLARLGFDISPFGTDTIVVNGVPEGYSCEAGKIQTMVSDLLLILSDDSSSLPGVMEAAMAEKIALLGASSCDPLASPMEARHLLDTLLSSSNPELTGNGKRIMAIMTSAQVEKLF